MSAVTYFRLLLPVINILSFLPLLVAFVENWSIIFVRVSDVRITQ